MPIKYWTGMSQLFLRPILLKNKLSTIGAHNNFKLNGQNAKLKVP